MSVINKSKSLTLQKYRNRKASKLLTLKLLKKSRIVKNKKLRRQIRDSIIVRTLKLKKANKRRQKTRNQSKRSSSSHKK